MKIFSYKKDSHHLITFLGIKIKIKSKVKKHKNINFKTFQELATIIRKNIYKLPNDIDLIVGIPRSGMIPAYICGLFLNKQVCSLSEFLNDIKPLNGERNLSALTQNSKILFLDDSISSGNALNKVKKMIIDKYGAIPDTFLFGAIFAHKKSKNMIDYFFEIVETPRLFQWNYLNHIISEKCCFDMDGVLCVDPTNEQNDDGSKYIDFILNAKPLFIPKYEILAIVTSRLEKYRKETELWLKNNNVKYKHLYMLNVKTAEERRTLGCHAKFKSKIYKNLDEAICFIESESKQAEEIAKLSGKQCICVTTDEYFNGK